jgi:hypothetical protein
MRTPKTVPYGADRTVYLIVDRLGSLGTIYWEAKVEKADLETITLDFISGQFSNPIRIVAFNTVEHWSEDVSEYVAFEIQTRCDIQGNRIPDHIRDFVEERTRGARQLSLRLV